MAEGGIAAALGNVDPKDSWEVHFSDTIVEGQHLSHWRMAEIFAKEAIERVYELDDEDWVPRSLGHPMVHFYSFTRVKSSGRPAAKPRM